jgi:hypothetical protein
VLGMNQIKVPRSKVLTKRIIARANGDVVSISTNELLFVDVAQSTVNGNFVLLAGFTVVFNDQTGLFSVESVRPAKDRRAGCVSRIIFNSENSFFQGRFDLHHALIEGTHVNWIREVHAPSSTRVVSCRSDRLVDTVREFRLAFISMLIPRQIRT